VHKVEAAVHESEIGQLCPETLLVNEALHETEIGQLSSSKVGESAVDILLLDAAPLAVIVNTASEGAAAEKYVEDEEPDTDEANAVEKIDNGQRHEKLNAVASTERIQAKLNEDAANVDKQAAKKPNARSKRKQHKGPPGTLWSRAFKTAQLTVVFMAVAYLYMIYCQWKYKDAPAESEFDGMPVVDEPTSDSEDVSLDEAHQEARQKAKCEPDNAGAREQTLPAAVVNASGIEVACTFPSCISKRQISGSARMHGLHDGHWQDFVVTGLNQGNLASCTWDLQMHIGYSRAAGGGLLTFTCSINHVFVGIFSVEGSRRGSMRQNAIVKISETFYPSGVVIDSDEIRLEVRANVAVEPNGGNYAFVTNPPGKVLMRIQPAPGFAPAADSAAAAAESEVAATANTE
jgi:hypothetical protein